MTILCLRGESVARRIIAGSRYNLDLAIIDTVVRMSETLPARTVFYFVIVFTPFSLFHARK